MKRSISVSVLCWLLLAAVFCGLPALAGAEATEEAYTENEWNYVDGAMDISSGIPEDAAGVLDRIRRTGVLRVATEPYFAPQEFIDPELSGQEMYVGADMKLARLIAQRMGVELEIIPMDFSQVLPALTEDLCDLTISAIAFTPGRASAYAMSKGYYFADSVANTGFVIRADDLENITSEEDLSERTIVAQSSSLQETMVAGHVHSYREFRRLTSVQSVYDAVRNRRADAGAVDLETAENWIQNNPQAGLAIARGMYYALEDQFLGDRIVAKKGELQLIYFVNAVINEVLEDGSYMTWIEEAQQRANELGL